MLLLLLRALNFRPFSLTNVNAFSQYITINTYQYFLSEIQLATVQCSPANLSIKKAYTIYKKNGKRKNQSTSSTMSVERSELQFQELKSRLNENITAFASGVRIQCKRERASAFIIWKGPLKAKWGKNSNSNDHDEHKKKHTKQGERETKLKANLKCK